MRLRGAIAVLALALPLAACQPTPGAPTVSAAAQGAAAEDISPAARARIARFFQPAPPPVAPAPFQRRLDDALRADSPSLNGILDELRATHGRGAVLDWSLTWHLAGRLDVSGLYVRELIQAGRPALQETAVLVWLYMLAAGSTDLTRCGDPSAGGYVDRLFQPPFDEVARHAATLAPDRLRSLARTAIGLEADIAPDREASGFVCRFGMDRLTGRPERIRAPAEWRPLAEARRRELPDFMATLIRQIESQPRRP